jgi:hypothetical protein
MISEDYLALNKKMHEESDIYGTSGQLHADQVMQIATSGEVKEILDYGCGKQTLNRSLPQFIVRGYDPAIPGLDEQPKPHEMVVITDVMEHVETEYVDEVLDHIESLTERAAYFSISTQLALKSLPDGRNAHISVHDGDWWKKKLEDRFDVVVFIDGEGVIAVVEKRET